MVFLVYENDNEASMHMMSERLWNNVCTRSDIDLHQNRTKQQSFDGQATELDKTITTATTTRFQKKSKTHVLDGVMVPQICISFRFLISQTETKSPNMSKRLRRNW